MFISLELNKHRRHICTRTRTRARARVATAPPSCAGSSHMSSHHVQPHHPRLPHHVPSRALWAVPQPHLAPHPVADRYLSQARQCSCPPRNHGCTNRPVHGIHTRPDRRLTGRHASLGLSNQLRHSRNNTSTRRRTFMPCAVWPVASLIFLPSLEDSTQDGG